MVLALAAIVVGCPKRAPSTPDGAGSAQHRMCEAFEAEQRPFVERLRALFPERVRALAPLGRCWPTARGAWALSVDQPIAFGSATGRWSIVHLDASGARVAIGPTLVLDRPLRTEAQIAAAGVVGHDVAPNLDVLSTTIDGPSFFDFDGDGEPEMFLRLGDAPKGLERAAAGRLWTFRHGAGIERYAPAKDLDVETLRDVDGDGRPDLVTYSPYVPPSAWRISCARVPSYRAHGPPFVAHALADGTFSRSDDVAVREAHRVCPSQPKLLVAEVDGVNDGLQTVRNLACARFLGATMDEVVSSIDFACAPGCEQCDDADLWKLFASYEPPPR